MDTYEYVNIKNGGNYVPWHSQLEQGIRCNLSKKMMDFKKVSDPRHAAAVEFFATRFCSDIALYRWATSKKFCVREPLQIAIVPSHTKDGISPALITVAQALAAKHENVHVITSLKRTQTVRSAHDEGGDRSISHHMQTIEVDTELLIPDVPVLLLDDVATSGGSMSACYHLLRQAGVKKILPYSLLQTV